MSFIQNLPFFSIMLAMFTGVVCSMLRGKKAKYVCMTSVLLITAMSVLVLYYVYSTGTSFVYWMGHFPAPWGNELRAGVTEALTACVFSVIVFLSLLGGSRYTEEIKEQKQNYLYLLTSLLLGALLALIYTNDIFTAYVFIEINTIAACGLIMIRHTGRAVASAIQYMVMSLLGSGLVLIGITLLYTLTGHLLMSNIKETIVVLVADGTYTVPLIAVIGLITVGLAIKSGLYPFHLWIPDAYSNSVPTSSALLSGLASKGYIFLLIKIYYRVLGIDLIISSRVLNVVFICGIIAMIMGSVHALMEGDIRRMSAYSSVSHIGYIFMCIGMGSELGMTAAVFHLYTHAITKAMLFLSVAGIADVSGLRVGETIHLQNAEGLVAILKKHSDGKEMNRTRIRQKTKRRRTGSRQELLLESIEVSGITEVFDNNLQEIKHHPDVIIRKPYSDSNRFDDIRGAGYRNWTAGIGYSIGALSIVGVPLFAGFASKIFIASSTLELSGKMWPILLALAASTILMVMYFLRMLVQLYLPTDRDRMYQKSWKQQKSLTVSVSLFIAVNLAFGLFSGIFLSMLDMGMQMFG